MLIILEGPDLAGKSTLARRLEARLRDDHPEAKVQIIHKGPPRAHPIAEYEAPLWSYHPGTNRHIICDRWHIGEAIYPGYLGRRSQYDAPAAWHIELALRTRGAVLLHVTVEDEVLMDRLRDEGDELVNADNILNIAEQYRQIIPGSILPRWTVDGARPACLTPLLEDAAQLDRQTQVLNDFRTYAGPPEPRLLLLGDVRGTEGRWARHSVPAFVPYPSTSGHYLLNALFDVDDYYEQRFIGLANACDVDDPVALWKVLGRPEVVTLGRNAERRLADTEIKARNVPHPQYVRRFRNAQSREYADMILKGREVAWR